MSGAEAQRRWRARHPDRAIKTRLNHPQFVKRAALRKVREESGCLVCGEKDGRCLAFHHRIPTEKSFSIGQAVNRHTLEELLAEAAKCDVLCHNCHAKEHA